MNTNPLRVGVVGLGLIAQTAHLPALKRLTDLYRLTHVCDLSPTLTHQIATSLGPNVRAATDAVEVIDNPDVDAVLILTSGSHASAVISALDAGKHVFVEKPLALSLEELDSVEQATRRSNVALMVGYMKTHERALRTALELRPETDRLRLVRTTVLHPTTESQLRDYDIIRGDDISNDLVDGLQQTAHEAVGHAIGDVGRALSWIYRKVALGSLVHQVAVLRVLLGSQLTVQAVRMFPHTPPNEEPPEPPSLLIDITGPNGVPVRIDWLWVPDHPHYEERTSLYATTGSLTIEFPPPYEVTEVARVHGSMTTRRAPDEAGAMNAFTLQLVDFHNQARFGSLPDLSGIRSELVLLQDLVGLLADEHGIEPGGELGRRRREVVAHA